MPSRQATILIFLLLACFCCSPIAATIEIVKTGATYDARPDKLFGLPMRRGLPYEARLQQLEGNAYLCHDENYGKLQNWNVTVPDDGLPVALLVRKGLCSFQAKAQYASKLVYPPGVVKFLVIDGDFRIHAREEHDVINPLQNDDTPRQEEAAAVEEEHKFVLSSRSLRHSTSDITVSMLHVTNRVRSELWNILMKESSSVKRDGGTRIRLTADAPRATGFSTYFWVSMSVLLAVTSCFCFVNAIANLFEAVQEQPEQPTRPSRRRLTREQVQAKSSSGVFDGTTLVLSNDSEQQEQLDEPMLTSNATSLESLEECSICLDEYVTGDKLRCLPCGHTFHSSCICKWLTERSATCPLCKIDLYESEDEEEHEENDEPQASTPDPPTLLEASWASVPPEATTSTSPEATATPTPPTTTNESSERRWSRRGRLFSRWGRSLFASRDQIRQEEARDANESMAEPLLLATGSVAMPLSETETMGGTDTPSQQEESQADPVAQQSAPLQVPEEPAV